MYCLALLALVASVSANVLVNSKCPEITPVDNFDFAAYAQGTWYEVARYPNSAEKDAECGSAEYTLEGDVAKVKNIHVLSNKLKVIEGTHKLAPGAGKFGKIIVNLPYGANGAIAENDLNILVFNDEYLIGYYCKNIGAKEESHQDLAWVLSRSKTLSANAKAAVDKFLKDSKVLDSSKFVWPSFSDKDCKINA